VKNRRAVIVLCGLFLPLAGCGIQGKWALSDVDPTAATRDFEFANLTLQKDGSFYAEEIREGRGIRTSSGTYDFDRGVLRLKSHDGKLVAYDAAVQGNELELERFWQGQKIKATFTRQTDD